VGFVNSAFVLEQGTPRTRKSYFTLQRCCVATSHVDSQDSTNVTSSVGSQHATKVKFGEAQVIEFNASGALREAVEEAKAACSFAIDLHEDALVEDVGEPAPSFDRAPASGGVEKAWWVTSSLDETLHPIAERPAPKWVPYSRWKKEEAPKPATSHVFQLIDENVGRLMVQVEPTDDKWCARLHKTCTLDKVEAFKRDLPSTLFLALPPDPSTDKVPTGSDAQNADFLAQLCNRHRGEAVEAAASRWELVDGPLPTSGPLRHKQFDLAGERRPDYKKTMDFFEYGEQFVGPASGGVKPDWRNMVNRLLAPASGGAPWQQQTHFRRKVAVVTLATLFCDMGLEYAADSLYDWYLSRRVVVIRCALVRQSIQSLTRSVPHSRLLPELRRPTPSLLLDLFPIPAFCLSCAIHEGLDVSFAATLSGDEGFPWQVPPHHLEAFADGFATSS